MPTLHITLGDKGGIGKTFVATLMAQYLGDTLVDMVPTCIDLDPTSRGTRVWTLS